MTASIIYLDANSFIYAVEGDATTAEPIKTLFFALRQNPGMAITSELTLAEVLAPPDRKDALPLHVKRRLYLDLLVWSRFIDLKPVSRDVLYETADLRNVAKMKLPDAIHLVTAIQNKCRYFVSKDRRLKIPRGMKLVPPDKNGIAQVLKEIA